MSFSGVAARGVAGGPPQQQWQQQHHRRHARYHHGPHHHHQHHQHQQHQQHPPPLHFWFAGVPPPPPPRRFRGPPACAAVGQDGRDAAGKSPAGVQLQAGQLVAYSKGDKETRIDCALLLEPEGKGKNWVVLTGQPPRRASVPVKAVSLVLPGAGHTKASLAALEAAAAEAAADTSLLELAWECVAADGDSSSSSGSSSSSSHSLPAMARLLFDADGAKEQWTAFRLLLDDGIFFSRTYRGGLWSFQPQDAAAVQAAAAAAAAEAAEASARASFLDAWSEAVAATSKARPASVAQQRQAWLEGPHKERVQALLDLALKAADKPPAATEQLARDTLALLKRRPEPAVAAAVLQEAGLLRLHEPLPLLRLGRNAEGEFPPRLQAAAEALLASPPPDLDAATRQDLTHLTVFTIDDAATTEVDDGLSVEVDAATGEQRLWVHVADPTRWLQPGDLLDLEARRRTRTLYFPFGPDPMFPRVLAEGPFSLCSTSADSTSTSSSSTTTTTATPPAACDALSVCVTLAEDGSLGELVCVTPSRLRVAHRLTYDQADADLALGPGSCAHPGLQALYEAARLRRAWRVGQGCIDIDSFEAKLEVSLDQLDAATPAVTCTRLSQWTSAARSLVAEMMILAGEAAGSLGVAAGLPLPYRSQEAPSLPPAEVVAALPDGPCRGFALRRCMTRSAVGPEPARHASLALPAYVQLTSPIRRYTDLVAHFNIKAHLRGAPPPFSASDIATIVASAGEVARELGRAEGDVEKSWAAEHLRQRWARLQAQLRQQRLAGAATSSSSTSSSSSSGDDGEPAPQQPQQQPLLEGLPAMVLGSVRPDLGLTAVTLEEQGLETVIKVDFPAEPGERLLLQLVDVDVPAGFYRLCVIDRLNEDGQASSISSMQLVEVVEEGEDAMSDGSAPDGAVSWRSSSAAAE